MRALRVGIFENKWIGNCSNHGISETYDHILLVCPDGNVKIDEENPPANLCHIVERKLFGDGKIYRHVEPVAKPEHLGWMYGGCLVYSSDARFGNEPMRLHDRQETQELYDMLSR